MSINKLYLNYSQPILSTNHDNIPIIDYAYSQITYLKKEDKIIHNINIDKIIQLVNTNYMNNVKIIFDLNVQFKYKNIVINFNDYSYKKEDLNKIKKFILLNSNENLKNIQINNHILNNVCIKNKKFI